MYKPQNRGASSLKGAESGWLRWGPGPTGEGRSTAVGVADRGCRLQMPPHLGRPARADRAKPYRTGDDNRVRAEELGLSG
ncbi:hypothetical protein NL676_005563 [Syzygium grande]|nr:hypothetical protein NL676_005563 [Syzygium grande]